MLALRWLHVGSMAYVGFMLAHVGVMLAYVGSSRFMLGQVGSQDAFMLAPADLQMPTMASQGLKQANLVRFLNKN